MPNEKRSIRVIGGPGLNDVCFSLFDGKISVTERRSVLFKTEISDEISTRELEMTCCIDALGKHAGGWNFRGRVINLDVLKELKSGDYNAKTRIGHKVSLSESITYPNIITAQMPSLEIIAGPDRYDLAEALIYGDAMNRRTVSFQVTNETRTEDQGWEATILYVERIDMMTQTFGFKTSMDQGDNRPFLGVGTYSTFTKKGFVLLE